MYTVSKEVGALVAESAYRVMLAGGVSPDEREERAWAKLDAKTQALYVEGVRRVIELEMSPETLSQLWQQEPIKPAWMREFEPMPLMPQDPSAPEEPSAFSGSSDDDEPELTEELPEMPPMRVGRLDPATDVFVTAVKACFRCATGANV